MLGKHEGLICRRVLGKDGHIHAGLLARRARSDDMAALSQQGYHPIDLVAVNLYPFLE